jgi:hypothetical protein
VLCGLIKRRLTGHRGPAGLICAYWCGTAIMQALIDLIAWSWIASAAASVSAVLAVLWYWWHRKGWRRLLAPLTGKYKYIRDAMVRVMKERGRTRPALRPVPGLAQ